MDNASNKGLYTLIAIVVFGIFISLSYWLFQDQMKSVLADVMGSATTKVDEMVIGGDYFENTTSSIDDFTYTEIEGGIRLTTYTGTSKALVVPNEINGIPVISIEVSVFQNKGLTSLILPETLQVIESGTQGDVGYDYVGAFPDNMLTSLIVPSSVKTIGNHSFTNNNLANLTISEGVEVIGYRAFKWNKLTTVVIPNSVTTLYDGSFGHNELTSVVLGSGLTYIGNGAFYDNNLTSVTVPESVTVIKSHAFTLNPLTSALVPKTTVIESGAFPASTVVTRY